MPQDFYANTWNVPLKFEWELSETGMEELANTLGDLILMAERRLEATGDEWWRKVIDKAEEAARLCAVRIS